MVDLILFTEASVDQASVIKTILDRFCLSSGQAVSKEKTRIFFSNNVSWHVKNDVSECLEFQRTEDLGKYLGVPIFHKRANNQSLQFILDKVSQRLSNWKTRSLSLAGRVTLAKFVLQALPSYIIQTTLLPKSVCDEVDKKCRNFVWGDSDQQRHYHTVAWESICQPKRLGGLGLRSMRDINSACMIKAGWKLCNQKDDLWVSIVRSKYKCGSDLVPKIQVNRPGSNFWRGVCQSWEHVQNNMTWKIGDGNRTKFWKDHWVLGCNVLENENSRPLSLVESFKYVKDYYDPSNGWNIQHLSSLLPPSIVNKIRALPGPMEEGGEDALTWKLTPDGSFSMASAVSFLQGNIGKKDSQLFSSIWSWKGPERIRLHLWKMASGALLTNEARARRGSSNSADCPSCVGNVESIIHVSRDCPFARDLWKVLLGSDIPINFVSLNLQEWLLDNLGKNDPNRRPFGVLLSRCLWIIFGKSVMIESSIIKAL